MISNQFIDKNEIRSLIPHTGVMCLLDEVIQWDEKQIICLSNTHLSTENPLRYENSLPAYALIEYGAQAMAIHGGLLSKASGHNFNEGYLAALRDVQIKRDNISDIKSVLRIEANQQMASEGNMIYSFTVSSDNELLISGRATVITILRNQGE